MTDLHAAPTAGSHLEEGAGDVLDRIRALEPQEQEWGDALPRNLFLTSTAAIVLGIVLTLAVQQGGVLFSETPNGAPTPSPFPSGVLSSEASKKPPPPERLELPDPVWHGVRRRPALHHGRRP